MTQVPLVPVFLEGVNSGMFVDVADLPPIEFEVGGIKQLTSALKPGSVNLMGLALSQPLLAAGVVGYTDCIDARMLLSSIVVKKPTDIAIIDTTTLARTGFKKSVDDQPFELSLTFDAYVSKPDDGSHVKIQAEGTVNLQTGNLNMVFLCDDPDYVVIGYTLKAYFHNPNSRAAVDAVNNVM